MKVYVKVLEKKFQLIVKPQAWEEQNRFHSDHEIMDQLFMLSWIIKGNLHSVYMCYVDLEKVSVSPKMSCGRC